jgi:hypothetical protein
MFSLFSLTLYILIAAIGLIMGLSSKQAIANLQVIKPNPVKVFRLFLILFTVAIVINLTLSYFATNSLTSANIPDEGSMKFQNFKSVMIFMQNLFFLALVVIANIYSLARKKISPIPYLLAIVLYTFFVLLDAHYLSDYYVVWQKSLRILKGELPDFHSTAWIKCGLGASVTIFNAVMIWWGIRK